MANHHRTVVLKGMHFKTDPALPIALKRHDVEGMKGGRSGTRINPRFDRRESDFGQGTPLLTANDEFSGQGR